MRGFLTNRLFQVVAAAVIVACLGYVFFGTDEEVDAVDITAITTSPAETTNAVEASGVTQTSNENETEEIITDEITNNSTE